MGTRLRSGTKVPLIDIGLAARDRTCRFPGCTRRATRCDIDHGVEYDHEHPEHGGATTRCNLHHLCRHHHNLKTRKRWRVDIHPDGSETWTSPLGFSHTRPPAHYPIDHLTPPDEPEPPEPDSPPPADPDPPAAEPHREPPPLTDHEYYQFWDAVENSFGAFADRAYDTLRNAGLIA